MFFRNQFLSFTSVIFCFFTAKNYAVVKLFSQWRRSLSVQLGISGDKHSVCLAAVSSFPSSHRLTFKVLYSDSPLEIWLLWLWAASADLFWAQCWFRIEFSCIYVLLWMFSYTFVLFVPSLYSFLIYIYLFTLSSFVIFHQNQNTY